MQLECLADVPPRTLPLGDMSDEVGWEAPPSIALSRERVVVEQFRADAADTTLRPELVKQHLASATTASRFSRGAERFMANCSRRSRRNEFFPLP